jgi:ribonuclease BN (tRNA processing enzyme)
MQLTVLGSGDAFGSGGRLQTSFHVQPGPDADAFLIDCGVTSIMGLERAGLDPDRVSTILVSHLHGDHFGGLVWWLLHGQHIARRTRPLTVAGPPGIAARFRAATEALYPGAMDHARSFEMRFVDLTADAAHDIGAITVTPVAVSHPSGAPSYALRIVCGPADARRIIGFSGDTEWVDALRGVAADTDLYITECYAYETPTRFHMSWRDLRRELPTLGTGQVLVTHMGRIMLAHRAEIVGNGIVVAEDGMVLDL